jgi:hypothetical protein
MSMPPGSHQILAVCSLGMPAFGSKHRCWVVHAGVGFETSVLVVHAGARLKTLVLGRTHQQFCVGPYPSTTTRGGGEVRGGVGCPHSQTLSWPAFRSIWWFSASVRIRVRVCWPSTDRWWVPTALSGVSTPFSQRSRSWVALTDLGTHLSKYIPFSSRSAPFSCLLR